MDVPRKPRSPRTARIKAAKALKKLPTALLLKKKAECDAKALRIVEHMIEPGVKIDWLLENLGQINRSHMDDIAEERSIVKLCGYPLCDNPLKKIVRKQYQISTLRNKVYDISRVKNFCSYGCYTATEYLMEQMLTSPLWVREDEEIPKFEILPKKKSRSGSPPGVEVDLIGIKLPDNSDNPETTGDVEKDETETQNRCFDGEEVKTLERDEQDNKKSDIDTNENLTNEFRSEKLREVDESRKAEDGDAFTASKMQKRCVSFSVSSTAMETEETQRNDENALVTEDEKKIGESVINQSPMEVEMTIDSSQKVDARTKINSKVKADEIKSTNVNDENPEVVLSPNDPENPSETSTICPNISQPSISQPSTRSSSVNRKSERRKSRESKIETMSLETLTQRVEKSFVEWITEETVLLLHGEDTEKRKIIDSVHRQEKYAVLCKKLNHLQLEEEREENVRIGELKPAPNFSTLQEEAKGLDLKVRAFFEGRMVIDPSVDKAPVTAKQEENQPEVVLPLLDLHAPKALRRRIFLDKLNRVLPDLLRALAGSGQTSSTRYSYTSERCAAVKALVSTFSLSATNITFKTAEWTLVALIIIKLLSCMDFAMKNLLSSRQGSMYISMILMTYKLDSTYLDRLILWTTSLSKTTGNEDS